MNRTALKARWGGAGNLGLIVTAIGLAVLACGCNAPAAEKSPIQDIVLMAPPAKPMVYECHKATSAIKIDGKLDDAAWQAAPWTEVYKKHGKPPNEAKNRWRAKALWDEKYLYLACYAEDTNIFTAEKGRDKSSIIFKGDVFEVFLNANKDQRHVIEINYGIGDTFNDYLCLIFPKDDPYLKGKMGPKKGDQDYRILWSPMFDFHEYQAAVHINGTPNKTDDKDAFWSVELAIPLGEIMCSPSSMAGSGWKAAVPPADGEEWLVNFCGHDALSRKPNGDIQGNWVTWARYDPPGGWFHQPWNFGILRFVHPKP